MHRTLKAFDMWLKKGARGTDYVFPSEMLVMMNVIVDFKNQHRYNEDEFLDRIQAEMRSSLMERVFYYSTIHSFNSKKFFEYFIFKSCSIQLPHDMLCSVMYAFLQCISSAIQFCQIIVTFVNYILLID